MKTKRKDKFKNRFKPTDGGRTIPELGRWKSIDGTWEGLRFFPEKIKLAVGLFCGRCASKKIPNLNHNKKLKCPNRKRTKLTQYNFWYCEIGKEKFV